MNRRTPTYRLHKPSGRAVVTLNGTDFYLGKYGSPESRERYDQLVAEWLTSGRLLPTDRHAAGALSVSELILRYWQFAETYYRKNGKPTGEISPTRSALRFLRKLYGRTPARDFGPLKLKACREAMIDADLCRGVADSYMKRIRRMFRWATENELVPPEVYHGLQAVRGLGRGRSRARETEPVKPVPEDFVNAVQPHVSPQVWAMVQLQLLTGMRPGELAVMRGCHLDVTGKIWVYTPSHKTEHHGHEHPIYIGPKAQEVLRPWLRTDLNASLFSPREAEEARNQERRRQRKSPMTPSQARRRPKRNRRRPPREHYTVGSYRRAITRACDDAEVPHWTPHRLRHNCGTRLRKEYGIEAARVVLGHRSAAITEVYAEVDHAKAMQIMAEVG